MIMWRSGFNQYLQYPWRLSFVCKSWNPFGYLAGCVEFLRESTDQLDACFSAKLQKIALSWGDGTESAAIDFLASRVARL